MFKPALFSNYIQIRDQLFTSSQPEMIWFQMAEILVNMGLPLTAFNRVVQSLKINQHHVQVQKLYQQLLPDYQLSKNNKPVFRALKKCSLILVMNQGYEYITQALKNWIEFNEISEIIMIINPKAHLNYKVLFDFQSQFDDRVQFILNSQDESLGTCLNQGLAIVKEEYILIAHPGMISFQGWLSQFMTIFEQQKLDLFSPGFLYDHGFSESVFSWFNKQTQNLTIEFDLLDEFTRQHLKRANLDLHHAKNLNLDCLLTRREVVECVGGFDFQLQQPFELVLDFTLRSMAKGFKGANCAGFLLHLLFFQHHPESKLDDVFKLKWPHIIDSHIALSLDLVKNLPEKDLHVFLHRQMINSDD